MSFFFIDSAFDLYWLKKAHFYRRGYTTVMRNLSVCK